MGIKRKDHASDLCGPNDLHYGAKNYKVTIFLIILNEEERL